MTLKELTELIKIKHPTILDLREIEDLLGFYLKLSWSQVQLNGKQSIGVKQQNLILKGAQRLALGEPLAYITGIKFFYKSEFFVSPDVLIPRPETEILVDEALQYIPKRGPFQVLDLGAGTGCIGLSIAKERPDASIYLIEASAAALAIARKNQESLDLRQVHCLEGTIGDPTFQLPYLHEKIDLIVANPPYIANSDPRVARRVHDFEPHQALYADNQGLMWIHKWLIWGYDYLRLGGVFIFEFGQDQEEAILPLLDEMAYTERRLVRDYSGINRFLIVHKEG